MSQVIPIPTATERHSAARWNQSGRAVRTEHVHVVFTTLEDTLAAARVAHELGRAMRAPVTVTYFRTVPLAEPLDRPTGVAPVEMQDFISRLRAVDVDARVRQFVCRDEGWTIPFVFEPHSLIVIAGRRGWWSTPSERWRRTLQAAGHVVVFVDTTRHQEASRA